MDNKPSENAFQEVIRKSKLFRETLRERNAKQADIRDKNADDEARREGFDRAIRSARQKSQVVEVKAPEPDTNQ
jgi:hypothetical protein